MYTRMFWLVLTHYSIISTDFALAPVALTQVRKNFTKVEASSGVMYPLSIGGTSPVFPTISHLPCLVTAYSPCAQSAVMWDRVGC